MRITIEIEFPPDARTRAVLALLLGSADNPSVSVETRKAVAAEIIAAVPAPSGPFTPPVGPVTPPVGPVTPPVGKVLELPAMRAMLSDAIDHHRAIVSAAVKSYGVDSLLGVPEDKRQELVDTVLAKIKEKV